jgi:hypothetical protein
MLHVQMKVPAHFILHKEYKHWDNQTTVLMDVFVRFGNLFDHWEKRFLTYVLQKKGSLKTKGIFLRWMAFKAQGVIQTNQGAQRMWGKSAEWRWKDTMTKYQNKVFDVIQRKYVEEREEKVIGKRRDKKVGQEEE